MEVHAPLPSITNPMIKAAHKLIERIPLNKPITRNNWGFRYGNQRDLSSRYSVAYRQQLKDEIPGLKRDEFGENIFLRVEHQTLTRLLRSSQILFTIHTYNSPLRVEASNIERARTMLAFLKTTPAELIEYKVMTPFYEKLIDYLTDAVSQ